MIFFAWCRKWLSSQKPRVIHSTKRIKRSPIFALAALKAPRFSCHERDRNRAFEQRSNQTMKISMEAHRYLPAAIACQSRVANKCNAALRRRFNCTGRFMDSLAALIKTMEQMATKITTASRFQSKNHAIKQSSLIFCGVNTPWRRLAIPT